ncbi:MAG: hypothetical protein ACE5Z5_07055 [Candidatus Bathyarchaeia archaeon]
MESSEVKEKDKEPIGKASGEPKETVVPEESIGKPWYCKEHGSVVPRESSGRMFCPICNKLVSKTPYEGAERGRGGPEEEGVVKPPEVEAMERMVELLRTYLPKVYGLPKKGGAGKIDAILDTLNPSIALSRSALHAHIKRYAPNADDGHLHSIINKVFWTLRDEGYLPSEGGMMPPYEEPYRFGRYGEPYGYDYGPRRHGGFYEGYGYPRGYGGPSYQGPQGPPRPQQKMKIVVEGQEIETDFAGYMAWKRYQADLAREKRDEEAHTLRMKKLEEEIKNISKGKSEGEERVEVEFEGQKIKVPVSMAHLYLKPKPKPEDKVEVEVGGKKIMVPASMAHLYLKPEESEETKRLRTRVEKQDEELKKVREEMRKKEMVDLRGEIEVLRDKVAGFDRDFDQIAARRGYRRTGRTTLDILDDIRGDIHETATRIASGGRGGEFKPEIKRTPEERRRKAKTLERRLEKKKDLLEAEDGLIEAARRLTK